MISLIEHESNGCWELYHGRKMTYDFGIVIPLGIYTNPARILLHPANSMHYKTRCGILKTMPRTTKPMFADARIISASRFPLPLKFQHFY